MAKQPSVSQLSNKYSLRLLKFKPQTSQLAADEARVSISTGVFFVCVFFFLDLHEEL